MKTTFVFLSILSAVLFQIHANAQTFHPGLSTPSSISRLIERIQDGSVRPEVLKKPKSRLNTKASSDGASSNKETPLTVTEIADQYMDAHLQIDPFWGALYNNGDLSQLGNDLSQETRDRYIAHYTNVLKQLSAIDPSKLSEFEKDTYDLLKSELTLGMEEMQLPFHLISISSWGGVRILDHINSAGGWFPFSKAENYDAFLKRSEQIPAWVDTAIAVLNEGIEKGITLDHYMAERTLDYIRIVDIAEFEKSPFSKPVQKFPTTLSLTEQDRLTNAFKAMYRDVVYPSLQRFITYYRDVYIPHTKNAAGLAAFGEIGKQMYAHRIALFGDKVIDPKDVHELGLKNVALIANALTQIKEEMGFNGTLVEFLRHMANADSSYYQTREEMLNAFLNLRAEVNGKTPNFFGIVPKTDYVIEEVLGEQSASSPSGSYGAPTEDRPYGIFNLNTGNLRSTPIFEMRSLSLHEASPGHHFQLSIAFELRKQLGRYRSVAGTNAFVEGWAHYAEFLGQEMGLYPTTLDRLGFWSDQMLRAVRLVVDSGIHAYGWNHEQVVGYMQSYLPNDLSDIESEANRYALWPGQALGYKIGQLQIIRLREQMKKQLGDKFDIRAFHDRVLRSGSLSLEVLEHKFPELN